MADNHIFEIKRKDTLPTLVMELYANGVAVPIVDSASNPAVAKLKMQDANGNLVINRTGVLSTESGTNKTLFTFQFTVAETTTAGHYIGEVEIYYTSSQDTLTIPDKEDDPYIEIRIIPDLG